jgi:hypothetical protein
MVEVTREERVENFIETYYRATAEVFSLSWGTSGKNQAQAEQRMRDTLLSLDKLGIKVRVEEDAVAQIIKTQGKIEGFGERQELEEKVSKLDAVDFIGKQELASVATMISLSDKQFLEWLELQKELRRLLRGLLTTKDGPKRRKTPPGKS